MATSLAGTLPAELFSHLWQAQDTQGDTLTQSYSLAMNDHGARPCLASMCSSSGLPVHC